MALNSEYSLKSTDLLLFLVINFFNELLFRREIIVVDIWWKQYFFDVEAKLIALRL